jgi:cytochrome c oxidase subunit 2
MKIWRMGIGRLATTGLAALGAAMFSATAWAEDLVGSPTPGGIGLQPAASPLKAEAIAFHDHILLPIIVGISLFVLALLLWVIIRYNKRANPVPARWSHNTPIEILWTVVPVLILVFIAIFSFRLLYAYHDMPRPDLTVKVTGNQWNWTYSYPDQGVDDFVSSVVPEDEARAKGLPYPSAADDPMVVPVGKVVRLLVTGSDVIHSVGMPAFGLKTDAIPGRVNETWFKADRTGVFYGPCSELCGVDHAFMPIQINVVTEAEFEAWVKSRGGSMTFAADQARAAAAKEAADKAAAQAAAAAAAAPAANPAATEAAAAAPAQPEGAAAPSAQ